jgi:TP901 family phage tail tape measure protein
MDNLQILLTGSLNTKSSVPEINKAISIIEQSKDLQKIKLKVDIDPTALDAIKKIAESVKNIPKPKIDMKEATKSAEIQMKQFKEQNVKYWAEIGEGVDGVKKKLGHKYGDSNLLNVTQIKGESEQLKSFSVNVETATGKMRQFNYEKAKVQMANGSEETRWVATLIRDLDITGKEYKEVLKLQARLESQLKSSLTKGSIDKKTHDSLLDNVKQAKSKQELETFQNTNKVLLAEYQTEEKITKEIEKQVQLLQTKMRNINAEGSIPKDRRSSMGSDLKNIKTMEDLTNFTKKYENELITLTATEKKYAQGKEKLSNLILKLGQDGQISEGRLKRLNSALNSSENLAQITKLEQAIARTIANKKKMDDINSFQRKSKSNTDSLITTAGSHVDISALKAYQDRVNSLSLRTKDYQNVLKQLGIEYSDLEKKAKSAQMSEKMMLDEAKDRLKTQLETLRIKGKIDDTQHKALTGKVDSATTSMQLKTFENENKILLAQYDVNQKNTKELQKQIDLQQTKMRNINAQGSVPEKRRTEMGNDLKSIKSMQDLTNFTQKYSKELATATVSEKKFSTGQDAMRNRIKQLGEDGLITEKRLKSLNNAVNTTKNVEEVKKLEGIIDKLEAKVKKKQKIELFQAGSKVDIQNLQRTYGAYIDASKLRDYDNAVKALTPDTKNLNHEMALLIKKFAELSANAKDAKKLKMPNLNGLTPEQQMKSNLTSQLQKMREASTLTEKSFIRLNNSINSSHNIAELMKLDGILKRQATRKENKFDVGLFKRQMETKIQNMTTTYGDKHIDQSALQKFEQSLTRLDPKSRTLKNDLKLLRQEMAELESNTRRASGATEQANMSMGKMLATALKKFPVWMLSATLFYAPIRALRSMTDRLIEIDTAMTQIRRVMDMPDFKFTELLESAVNMSDELATKLKDVLSIMGDFGRMGFNENQLVDITKTAQVTQNVSDLNSTEAVDTLTSAMLNFNVSAEDSMTIIDKLNEVDNNYAISTKDLADGIRKAGASAKTFGVDLDELVGYVSAIGSTTRESGAIVGNGLKTIFSRITTMDSAETALNNVGVSIKDMAGSVRPVSDIISDLAGRWTSLTDEQRQNLGVTLAGRHQLTRFLALMNNFDIAISSTNTSLNSQGSAMKEQEKFADSLEGRLNRLDTAWNKLTLAMGEAVISDGLVAGIEVLDALAKSVGAFVKTFGFLPTTLAIVGVALTLFNTKIKTLVVSMFFGSKGMDMMKLHALGITEGMTRAEYATLSLKTGLMALGAVTAAGVGFFILGAIIEHFIKKSAEAQRQAEEIKAMEDAEVEALTKNREQVEKLIEQYNGLTEARGKYGENNTLKQEEKYFALQQKLGELYPALIDHIDGAGRTHLKTKDAIEKEKQETYALIDAKKLQMQIDGKAKIAEAETKRNDLQKKIDDTKNEIANPVKVVGFGENQKVVQKSQEELDLLGKQLKLYEGQWSTASQAVTNETLKIADAYTNVEIDPSIQQGVDDFFNSIDTSKMNSGELESFSQQIGEATNALQEAYKNNDPTAFDQASDAIRNIGKSMGLTTRDMLGFDLSFEGLKKQAEMGAKAVYAGRDGFDGLDESVSEADGTMDEYSGTIGGVAETTNGLAGGTSALGGAMGDLLGTTGGVASAMSDNANASSILLGVTEDQIKVLQNALAVFQAFSGQQNLSEQQSMMLANATATLSAQFPQFTGNLAENTNFMSKQIGMMDALSGVSADNTAVMVGNENSKTRAVIEQTNQRINGYKKEAQALSALMDRIAASYDEEGMSGAKTNAYHNAQNRLGEIAVEYATAQASLVKLYHSSGVKAGVISTPKDNKKTGSGNSDSKDDKIEKTIDKYEDKLHELDQSIKASESVQSRYTEGSTKWIAEQKKQIKLLGQKKAQTELEEKALRKLLKTGKLDKDQKKEVNSRLKELSTTQTEYTTQIREMGLELADAKINYTIDKYESSISSLDDSLAQSEAKLKGYTEGSKEWSSEISNQIGLINKKKTANQNEINALKQILKTDNLSAEQKKELNKTIYALTTTQIEYNNSVKELQKQLSQAKLDKLLDSIADSAEKADRELKKIDDTIHMTDPNDKDAMLKAQESRMKKLLSMRKEALDNIKKLEDMRGSLAGNSEALKKNAEEIQAWKDKLAGIDVDIFDQKDAIKQVYEDIADAYIDAMKNAYETERDIKIKEIEKIRKAEEKAHEEKMKEFEEQSKALDEEYNKKMREIDDEASSEDYSKGLGKKQEELATLQSKINALSLDDSPEAKKQLAELLKQKAEKEEEMNDYINDHNREQRKQAIEDDRDARQKAIDDNKEAEDESFQERQDALDDQIEAIQKKYDDILNDEKKWNTVRQDILNGDIAKYKDELDGISDYIKNNNKEIGESISNNITDALAEAKKGLEAIKTGFDDISKQADAEKKKQDDADAKKRKDEADAKKKKEEAEAKKKKDAEAKKKKDAEAKKKKDAEAKKKKDAEAKKKKDAENDKDDKDDKDDKGSGKSSKKSWESIGLKKKKYSTPKGGWNKNNVKDRMAKRGYDNSVANRAKLYKHWGGKGTFSGTASQNAWLLKKMNEKGFRSGGYTGDWFGNDGKLAMLHKKEIVLNKGDTENFLKAIDITKDFANLLKNITIPKLNDSSKSGNTVNLNINIENLQGGKKGADDLIKIINTKIRGKGGLLLS